MSPMLLTSCTGKKGNDGRSYLTYDWDNSLYTYTDDTPIAPIHRSTTYNIAPARYYYSYECRIYDADGIGYTYKDYYGYFTIVVNHGEAGKIFWQDGKDGAARYFNIYLSWYGTSFSKPAPLSPPPRPELSKTEIPRALDYGTPEITRIQECPGGYIIFKYRTQVGKDVGK